MRFKPRLNRRLLAVSGAMVLLGATVGVAVGASGIIGPDKIVHGCYDSGGNLKVISYTATCPKGWTAIEWNQQGIQGLKGDQGIPGIQGLKGDQGIPGIQGLKGDQGIPGIQGLKGDQGIPGAIGPVGATGVTGATGAIGPVGATGAIGPVGSTGAQGDVGSQGPQGQPGPKGDTGATGAQGDVGPQGPAGTASGFGTTATPGSGNGFSECMLAEIRLSASNFAYDTPADGRLLLISQNTALFSLIGPLYGGDGATTFALPDLRAVTPKSANGQALIYSICTQGIFPTRH